MSPEEKSLKESLILNNSDKDLPSQPNTIQSGGERVWIYASEIRGRWQNIRVFTSFCLLFIFYATPWTTIDGAPFIRLSFLSSSFVLFGHHVLIYEFYHFAILALLLTMTLFLASALFGRIWCGYACPQTVFIEQILGRIEVFFEGSAAHRHSNDNKPLTINRLVRKILKQATFILVSFSFAFTFLAIFTGPELLLEFRSGVATSILILLTGLAWFDGAYWKEQFCHIVCPYARFQGIMQDNSTRTIGYDELRGEPRRRGKVRDGAGDCIACGLCVRVCPSGIDIRQGPHQLECIGCAKCIDACDGVMAQVGKPSGLIRYDKVQNFLPEKAIQTVAGIMRPRIVVYASIWLALFIFGVAEFVGRSSLHVSLLGVSGSVPYILQDNGVKNLFNIKIGNQGAATESYKISIIDPPGLKIESSAVTGPIAPGSEATIPMLVSSPAENIGGQMVILVEGVDSHDQIQKRRKIIGPEAHSRDN